MGVDRLFPYIQQHFGSFIKHFHLRFSRENHFNYVYIDANSVLHGIAQYVENYGEFADQTPPFPNLTSEERRLKIFELFFDKIMEITKVVKPTKVLYIAIDGPCPRAKQIQQRERRFIAGKSVSSNRSKFNSTFITPGTEFMHELSKFMFWRIRDYLNSGKVLYSIVFSSGNVPGEGEHKIMDFIRELPPSDKFTSSHCMVGQDADLIMLTLSSGLNKVFLYKDDEANKKKGIPGWVFLMNMGEIRKVLSQSISIPDFVFTGFFVGNDFLPKIKMFHKLEEGFEKMLNLRSVKLTINSRDVDIQGITKFVQEIAKSEVEFLERQASLKVPETKFVDHTLLKHFLISSDEGRSSLKLSLGVTSQNQMKGYRESYYRKAGVNLTDVKKMCEDYLRGLIWVFRYYSDTLPSWDSAYSYHYAPLMQDFASYLSSLNSKVPLSISEFTISEPTLPFEQLISVLPPSLSFLLPEHYQYLLLNENSPLVQAGYYPKTFEIDYEGKTKEHLGIPILPFMDYDLMRKAYTDRDKSSKYKYHRNEFGSSFSFKFDKNYTSKFVSEYGVILECKVSHIKLPLPKESSSPSKCTFPYIPIYTMEENVASLYKQLSINYVMNIFYKEKVLPWFLNGENPMSEFPLFLSKLKRVAQREVIFEGESDRSLNKAKEILSLIPGKLNENSAVLDFGAGDGSILSSLSKSLHLKKKNAIAVDINPIKESEFYISFTDLSSINLKVDCIILYEVLHHINPIHHKFIIQKLGSLLKSDGVIIVKEHDFVDNTYFLRLMDTVHEMWRVYNNEPNYEMYPLFHSFNYVSGLMQEINKKCVKIDTWTNGNFQRIYKTVYI